jgi:hypothetical protein
MSLRAKRSNLLISKINFQQLEDYFPQVAMTEQGEDMTTAKVISALGVLAMTAVLIYGFTVGDFASDGAKIVQNPWGIVSLVDLYTGFILFSGWIVYRERSLPVALIWVILMMVLGFFTGALYTFLALTASKGDWKVFWMGHRANG